MATKEELLLEAKDIELQATLLGIGKLLSEVRHCLPPRRAPQQDPPVDLDAEVQKALQSLRATAARKLFGISSGYVSPQDPIRIRALCYIAWQMISQSDPATRIEEIALALIDHSRPVGEQVILCRDVLGRMASAGHLLHTPDTGMGGWTGRLLLPPTAYSWATGGARSKADFSPSKVTSGPRKSEGSHEDGIYGGEHAIPSPRKLYEGITRQVLDCEAPAEMISSRLVMHMMRARMLREGKDPGTPNECWMIVGPPAVGKTYLCETACEAASRLSGGAMPFASADGSSLSAESYVGLSVSDCLRNLITAAGGDTEKARYGFLAIDEFSKKARSMGDSPVNTLAVQEETLRMISGQVMQLGNRRGGDRSLMTSTVGTGFALMGHCPGLDRMIEKRMGSNHMGFAVGDCDRRSRSFLMNALLDFGFIEELLTRQTAIILMKPPSLSTLSKSVTAEAGILASYNRLLAGRDASISLTPAAVQCLAEYGMEAGFFRAIKKAISTLVAEVVFSGSTGTIQMGAEDVLRAIVKADGGEAEQLSMPTGGGDERQNVVTVDEPEEHLVAG